MGTRLFTLQKRLTKFLLGILILFIPIVTASQPTPFPRGTYQVSIPTVTGVRTDLLQNIAPVIEKSISAGNYPGAVILASHRGHIIYRGVFGSRRILPNNAPMKFDTLFDLASLTKVVATTPAIMQLIEQGKIQLDAPVAKYWPAFADQGKAAVTIRELLTHTSGLPIDMPDTAYINHTKQEIEKQITQLKLHHNPGEKFLYSDLDFIVLAHVIEIMTGENFNIYVNNHILKPLGMKNTLFTPPQTRRDQIAPTEVVNHVLRWGEVHDPDAHAMGGVSGNAGLFSNANDLGVYAQCLLNGGRISQHGKASSRYLLGPLAVLKMTTPQTPPNVLDIRGLGWDIDSAYSNRGDFFPIRSFGHTGWTGTSIWIDPTTQTWLVILTSRTHPVPTGHNQLIQDRRTIADIVSASISDVSLSNENNTGPGELNRAYVKS